MRILLIEDNAKITAALGKTLRAEGFAVDTAPDGEKGENLAWQANYDVIVLDIMLPRQDGWETCRNLRRDGNLTPILMLTALEEVADRIRGLNTGADDYLPKPFHTGELIARIRALARRHTEVRSSRLEKFGLTLDQETHTALRDGREVVLSGKEFALLELLMMNAGRIVGRDRILEHVWDLNYDPRSNVIESFVRLLRQKVDRTFDKPLIHTVRGAGYMLSDRER